MGKVRSGLRSDGLFCPSLFHKQFHNGRFEMEATNHNHIGRVIFLDGTDEYIFWDEAGLASPGGATFEEAVNSFNDYCQYVLGDKPCNTCLPEVP